MYFQKPYLAQNNVSEFFNMQYLLEDMYLAKLNLQQMVTHIIPMARLNLKYISLTYGPNITLSTLKKTLSAENSRTGVMNSQETADFMISSLPPARPIIAWHSIFSFTICGLHYHKILFSQLKLT